YIHVSSFPRKREPSAEPNQIPAFAGMTEKSFAPLRENIALFLVLALLILAPFGGFRLSGGLPDQARGAADEGGQRQGDSHGQHMQRLSRTPGRFWEHGGLPPGKTGPRTHSPWC